MTAPVLAPGELYHAGLIVTDAPVGVAAHHLGYWVDDLTTAARNLENAGYRWRRGPQARH